MARNTAKSYAIPQFVSFSTNPNLDLTTQEIPQL
jgi:hypothetical protein